MIYFHEQRIPTCVWRPGEFTSRSHTNTFCITHFTSWKRQSGTRYALEWLAPRWLRRCLVSGHRCFVCGVSCAMLHVPWWHGILHSLHRCLLFVLTKLWCFQCAFQLSLIELLSFKLFYLLSEDQNDELSFLLIVVYGFIYHLRVKGKVNIKSKSCLKTECFLQIRLSWTF